VCPICHDPVVAESVVFSCHKHVPYCADCVATWVWRCVTTHPRLTGFPTCPHCRSLVVVDEHFKPNRGRWLEEYGAMGAAGAGFAAALTGSDRDWYERYLLDMVSEGVDAPSGTNVELILYARAISRMMKTILTSKMSSSFTEMYCLEGPATEARLPTSLETKAPMPTPTPTPTPSRPKTTMN
jgi:hypothetical protein